MTAVPPRAAHLAVVAALFASAFTALPAHALYKVVGPDGKVTYTDRPPTSNASSVATVNTATGGVNTDGLPYELRQVVQKYPVTLYTTAKCGPCDTARQFFRQRGVPFSERTIANAQDNTALQRVTGKTDLPALTIGSQVVSGFEAGEVTAFLDAAGYPKASKLPPGYKEPAPAPLTPPPAANAVPAPAPAAPSPSPSPSPAPDTPGFKF